MERDEVKRLKALEQAKGRLKKLSLDKGLLQEAPKRTWVLSHRECPALAWARLAP